MTGGHRGDEQGGYIGRPMKRIEDRPLLVGAGRYTDDIRLPGILHVHVVRSPHAHARLLRLDVAPARRAPGVVDAVTGEDVRGLGHLSTNTAPFPKMKVAPYPVMVTGIVRAVGDPIAAIVAETAAQARDAAELVEVEYEPLPPVVRAGDAVADGAPVLFPELGGNRAFAQTWRTGDVDRAFATAATIVRIDVSQPRLLGMAMETRGALAQYDPHTDELTVWTSTQGPFRVRTEIAESLHVPESRVRVVAPDVGGGFGIKGAPYREEMLVAWLARRLRRPVKWIATRSEDALTSKQGRGGSAHGELAVAADGKILGVRARIIYPLGSHPMFGGPVPPWNHARTLPNAYVVPAVDIETSGAYTTTPSTGPYRGAGRPEGVFLMERLMDEAARALSLDPAEIRRRNFVAADAFPHRSATGVVYDSGNYRPALEEALHLLGYDRARQEQAEARRRGEIAGIGIASYVEPAAAGWESGALRIERTGAVTIVTGSSPHGQGHETTWAQIAADVLGVEPSAIAVRHGDTRGAPVGFGTFGSRSTALAGSAIFRAAGEVREKGRRIAASMVEAAVDDIVPAPGGFQVKGVPGRTVSWAAVASAAYRGAHLPPGDEPGLDATVFFKADAETWSFGTCLATVAIDRETGAVRLTRCVWVDDAGTLVNPLIVEGQLHGSYAQGAGQALLEAVAYDDEGQLLTGTLMDYAVPRLGDFPEPTVGESCTPSPRNPLGVKGVGEAGCIAVPPAIVNAVVDALAPWGVGHLDMPLSAERVWRVVKESPSRS